MNSIIAISLNTFKEAIRNRILYIILIFALLIVASSGILSELTIADRKRIIVDLGFMAINLFGVAIAVFVGVSLVYNELEKRTIYTIVSKPIHRWQFLLGKFFGLLLTIYVNVLIMTVFFLTMLHYEALSEAEGSAIGLAFRSAGRAVVTIFNWGAYESTKTIMPVIAATCIELAMVTSFAILFSAFTTPVLSMFFTILTFISGRLNDEIVLFAQAVLKNATDESRNIPLSYYLAKGAAIVTPNLAIFHRVVNQALYEDEVTIGATSVLYAGLYATGVLCLAMLIFGRRNFK